MTGPDQPPLIAFDSVVRRFPGPPPHVALRPATFEIARSGFVAVTGPSGSGKSTLLNLLGLLDRPTEGSYRLDGVDVGGLAERDRARIRGQMVGFVFQSFELLDHRSALENVMLAGMYGEAPRPARAERSEAALHAVGLGTRASQLPRHMSGGERQRVAIARAIASSPRLLLCDEPTGNLDSTSTEQVMDLLQQINAEGVTIVLITHDPEVASRASRSLQIHDGLLTEGRR